MASDNTSLLSSAFAELVSQNSIILIGLGILLTVSVVLCALYKHLTKEEE